MHKIFTIGASDFHGLVEDVAGLAAISVLLVAGLFLPAFG